MNHRELPEDKYLEDIRTIKEFLLKTESQPIYENWAFYVWGVLVIVAGMVHYYVEKRYNLRIGELFLRVWLPFILLSGFAEIISLVRNLEKNSMTIFSRSILKFYMSLIGETFVFGFVVLVIIRLNGVRYLPLTFLVMTAGWYFVFAMYFYTQLFYHAFGFIVLGFILFLLNVDHRLLVPLIASIIGISSLVVGFTSTLKKRKEER